MPGLHECQSSWSTVADSAATKADIERDTDDRGEFADADKGKDGTPADVTPVPGPTSDDVKVVDADQVTVRIDHAPKRRGRPRKH